MKISSNSWHFKAFLKARGRYRKNTRISLCEYFWSVVFYVLLFIPFHFLSYPYYIFDKENLKNTRNSEGLLSSDSLLYTVSGSLLIVGCTSGIFLIIFIVWFYPLELLVIILTLMGVGYITQLVKKRRKHTNVLSEYIKFRKNKICPFIEITDDKEEKETFER